MNVRKLFLGAIFSFCIANLFSQSVGIGSTQFVPSGMLEVQGISTLTTDYALKIRDSTPADLFVVQNNGNVGIGVSSSSYKLTVNGDAYVSGHAGIGGVGSPSPNNILSCAEWWIGGSANTRTGIELISLLVPLGTAQTGDIIGINCMTVANAGLGANVSNMYGIKTSPMIQSSTNVTNLYSYYCSAPGKGITSSITNAYGLYIENIITATNNYSIYSAGGQNYLAGTLSVGSSISLPVNTQTANYTVTASDHTIFADVTAGGFTVTLPTAVGITGTIYVIKKIDATANVVSVQTTGGQTIDGAAPPLNIVVVNDRIIVQSNGANWFRID